MSCLCADVFLGRDTILSKMSENLTVKVRVGVDPSTRSAAVDFATNDPLHAHIRLTVNWKVVGPFELRPSTIALGRISPGDFREEVAEIFANSMAARGQLRITSVKSTSPFVQCHIEECSESSEVQPLNGEKRLAYRLRVRVDAIEEVALANAMVTLEVQDEDDRMLNEAMLLLPVSWTCLPPLFPEPRTIFFGSVVSGDHVERSLAVKTDAGRDVGILSAECEGEGLTSEMHVEVGADGSDRIVVRFIAPLTTGTYRANVRIRVAGESDAVLNVPVLAFVRK